MGAGYFARAALSLVVLASAWAAPAPARAQARWPATAAEVPLPPPPAGTALRRGAPGWRLGAGLEGVFSLDDKSGTGAALRLEAVRPWRELGADTSLDLVLAATFGWWGLSKSVLVPNPLPGLPPLASGTSDASAFLARAVPAARLSWRGFPGNRRLGLYGEGGLGVGLSVVSTKTDVTFQGKATAGETRFAVVLRLAGGGYYDLSEAVRLWLQPVGLDLSIGSGSSTYGLAAGATFRL